MEFAPRALLLNEYVSNIQRQYFSYAADLLFCSAYCKHLDT